MPGVAEAPNAAPSGCVVLQEQGPTWPTSPYLYTPTWVWGTGLPTWKLLSPDPYPALLSFTQFRVWFRAWMDSSA